MNAILLLALLAIGSATQPATSPSQPPSQPPAMPPGASPLHPGYTFIPIDPKWHASTLYLDIAHDRGILPSDPGPKDQFFTLVTYSETENSNPLKEVELYPGGRVFTETDMHVSGVDFIARGDVYTRTFRDDGITICFYRHDHDGKCADGFSITPGGQAEKVVNGNGTLTEPSDRGKPIRHFFGDGGYELLRHDGDDLYLADSFGQLHRKPDGAEELTLTSADADHASTEQWHCAVDGTVTGPRGAADSDSQTTLHDRFANKRGEFFNHFKNSAATTGVTLHDMGIEQIQSNSSTKPQ